MGGLVVVAVIAFVVLPLLRGRSVDTSTDVAAGPAEERAAVYRELLELELDQQVGKIAEADYRDLSDTLLARAAALISEEDAETAAADAQVEREIAAMRASLHRSELAPAEEIRP